MKMLFLFSATEKETTSKRKTRSQSTKKGKGKYFNNVIIIVIQTTYTKKFMTDIHEEQTEKFVKKTRRKVQKKIENEQHQPEGKYN